MEDQENAHYTVFLELEKEVVMDLEIRQKEEILSSLDY